MKRAVLSVFLLGVTAALVACGSSKSSGNSNDTASHIANRALVSNNFNGDVAVVNAGNNTLSSFTIFVGTRPTFMLLSGDKSTTVVFDANNNALSAIENAGEVRFAAIQLDSWSESVALQNDGQKGYAAVRVGIPAVGAPQGEVEVLDFKNNVVTARIAIPSARWLALDHAGKNVLAFTDTNDTVTRVDTTALGTATSIDCATSPTICFSVAGTFSRPVAAYFSSDDSKAYILSCGPECGGTAPANVTEVTVATGATRTVPVPGGAKIGLLNGTTLYVAGSPSDATGALTVIDTATMTASTPVAIGPGDHWRMAQAGNKVWIGARNCLGDGCLSIYDTGAHTVAPRTFKGDVTGMTPINGRNFIYVVEGGELRVYDITTGNEVINAIDIVGIAYDVVSLV